MTKTALICGISGQDGAYLAQLLLNKNYEVYGTSRDAQISTLRNLEYLGIRNKVKCLSMSLTDFRSVLQVLTQVEPDEVYNLAGQTSVGLSFNQPVETLESIATGTLHLLESIMTGTREISGSDAIKLRKRTMAAWLSSMASSMLMSMTWAPFSTC